MAEVFNVKMPDGTVIQNVPAGTTKAQLQAMLDKKVSRETQDVGVVEDVAKSAATGLGRGAVGLATFPFDIGSSIGGALGKYAVGKSTLGVTPESTVGKGLEYLFGQKGLSQEAPSALDAISGAIGADYKPQTFAGRAAELGGEFAVPFGVFSKAPTALGKLAQGLKYGTASGLTGEAAGTAFDSDTARMVGALAGPAGVYGAGKIMSRKPPVSIPTAEEVGTIAGQGYKAAEEIGGVIKPEKTNEILSKINEKVGGLEETAQAVIGTTPTTEQLARINLIKDQPLTLKTIDQIDKGLTDRIKALWKSSPADALNFKKIQNELRSHIANMGEDAVTGGKEGFKALDKARKDWFNSKKLEDIEDMLYNASISNNPSSTLKSQIRTKLKRNDLVGYTKPEVKAFEDYVKTGKVSTILNAVSSPLVQRISMGTGNFGGAAAAYALDAASKGMSSARGTRMLNKVARRIADPYMKAPVKKSNPFSLGGGLKAYGVSTTGALDELANNGGR